MTTSQTPLVDLLRLLSQAADEIERLRSNALALEEEEKNDYMDGVGGVLGQDHDGETPWAAAQRVTISRLREYAFHKTSCSRRVWDMSIKCDCGYDELIKEIGNG